MSVTTIQTAVRGNIKDQAISILIGLGLGIVATFLLYWFMSVLVAAGQNALTEAPQGRIVDFVRVPDPPQLRTHQPKPEKPDKPEVAPETPKLQVAVSRPRADSVNLGVMDVDTELAVDTSAGLSASDGEYLPIVKVAPIYPNRAQSRGIEGWVLLRFTVTASGSVVDPEVIDAEPLGVFDDAAKNAVVRFKYKPRVINGQARSVQGVEHLITFKMDD